MIYKWAPISGRQVHNDNKFGRFVNIFQKYITFLTLKVMWEPLETRYYGKYSSRAKRLSRYHRHPNGILGLQQMHSQPGTRDKFCAVTHHSGETKAAFEVTGNWQVQRKIHFNFFKIWLTVLTDSYHHTDKQNIMIKKDTPCWRLWYCSQVKSNLELWFTVGWWRIVLKIVTRVSWVLSFFKKKFLSTSFLL